MGEPKQVISFFFANIVMKYYYCENFQQKNEYWDNFPKLIHLISFAICYIHKL